jgi:sulfur-oxidizing protein SoxY
VSGQVTRRTFLRLIGVGVGALALGGNARLQEAMEPRQQESLEDAIARVLGTTMAEIESSDAVVLDIPDFVENAVNVPVRLSSTLPDEEVRAFHLFADRNPLPHVFSVYFTSPKLARILETRVRLAETAPVRGVLETVDGRFLMAVQEVGVGVGGC